MNKIAHIMPNYSKYGSIVGYICVAVGFNNIFCKNMKEAKLWCKQHGLEGIKI